MKMDDERTLDQLIEDMRSTGAVLITGHPNVSPLQKWEVSVIVDRRNLPKSRQTSAEPWTQLNFYGDDLEYTVKRAYRAHYFMMNKGTGLFLEDTP